MLGVPSSYLGKSASSCSFSPDSSPNTVMIGVLVDASIVMVENGHRHLSERQENGVEPVSESERKTILVNAAKKNSFKYRGSSRPARCLR